MLTSWNKQTNINPCRSKLKQPLKILKVIFLRLMLCQFLQLLGSWWSWQAIWSRFSKEKYFIRILKRGSKLVEITKWKKFKKFRDYKTSLDPFPSVNWNHVFRNLAVRSKLSRDIVSKCRWDMLNKIIYLKIRSNRTLVKFFHLMKTIEEWV